MEFQITAIVCRGILLIIITAETPKLSDPEKLFNIKKNNGFDFTEKSVKFNQEDIDKAIDDMKKEVVLEQYTYFVEPANLGTDADGTVRLKG
mgnify:CR=1 FL=1